MITLAIPEKHICPNPALYRANWHLAEGSLWECDECGREQMLVSKDKSRGWDFWRYTVQIIDKPMRRASRKPGVTGDRNE